MVLRMNKALQPMVRGAKGAGIPALLQYNLLSLVLSLALFCAICHPVSASDGEQNSQQTGTGGSQADTADNHSTTTTLEKSPAGQRPLLKVGADQSSFNLGVTESTIAWERWHRKVGKALHKSVEKATKASLGEVMMMITVSKDCNLTAQILSATSQKMGDACAAAATKLSGDTILIFPQESKRNFVKFKFEYRRGIFLWPHNRYITDDFEKLDDPTGSPKQETPASPNTTAPN